MKCNIILFNLEVPSRIFKMFLLLTKTIFATTKMKNEQKHSEKAKNNRFFSLKTQIKQISTHADQDFTIV